MAIRVVRSVVSANAGANSGDVTATTFNDNVSRRLTGVFVGDSTKLAHLLVKQGGQTWVDIDDSVFSAARGFLDLDIPFPIGQYFTINFVNDSGGNLASIPVLLRYEY